MIKYTHNSYKRITWNYKFKFPESIWICTCAFPNRRQATCTKGCNILLCIEQICPFNVWRWQNATTPSEVTKCVKMKFLSSQVADRLRGLDCGTGVKRYAEVRFKVVWVQFWVCSSISLHLKFVSNRRVEGADQFLVSDLDDWSISLSRGQLPPTFLSDSALRLQCALTDLYLKYT